MFRLCSDRCLQAEDQGFRVRKTTGGFLRLDIFQWLEKFAEK